MRVLITGANGLIGGFLAEQIIRDGHEVTVLGRSPSVYSNLRCRRLYHQLVDMSYRTPYTS